jgi:hypothetical protein
MKRGLLEKIIFEPGPAIILTLMGLLLLSGFIYYKAIKIQRFLEPALAISLPKIEFAKGMNTILSKQLGEKREGVFYTPDSIIVDGTLLLVGEQSRASSETQIFGRLAKVFLSIMKDPDMKKNIDMILISTKVYSGPDAELNKKMRFESQQRADFILDSIFEAEPELRRDFGVFFSASATPALSPEDIRWVEFRIIPTERIHMDVIRRFEKYVQ